MRTGLARAGRFTAVLLLAGSAWAQVAVPALTGRVTDTTGTLTIEQVASLDQRLAAFEARKGVQIAVLMVPSTQPEAIEQYALRAAEQWKLGRKKVDDGALLVIAKNDRALRIEVGYGLEGVLNDATSNRIIDEVIVPRFRAQDFAGGMVAGLDRMMGVIDGEPLPAPTQRARDRGGEELPPYVLVLVVVALAAGALLRGVLGRLGGSVATGGLVLALAWWLAGALSIALVAGLAAAFFTLMGGMGLMGMGGYAGGHGSGRGGGGFGGFSGGGGGFGGGGASGRW